MMTTETTATATLTTSAAAHGDAHDGAEIARRVMDAFNRRDIDTLLAHLHPDYEATWPHGTLAGLDAVAHEATILDAFPDVQMEIQHIAAIDTGAVLELMVTGTNTGPLVMAWGASFEPSGRALRLPMTIVMDLEGDVIRRERLYFDQRTILQQTGNAD